MILNDRQIEALASASSERPLVRPFRPKGLNAYGYDLTLSREFLTPVYDFTRVAVIDPMEIGSATFEDMEAEVCFIPSNGFVLGCSVETVTMPPDIIGICLGRSTYARCGIITNVTPLEAGWTGRVTIEISNTNPLPAKVYAGRGVVQVLFFQGEMPDRDYVAHGGRYQGQEKITLPRGEL